MQLPSGFVLFATENFVLTFVMSISLARSTYVAAKLCQFRFLPVVSVFDSFQRFY